MGLGVSSCGLSQTIREKMRYMNFRDQLMNALVYKQQLMEEAEVTDQWEPLIDEIDQLANGWPAFLAQFFIDYPSWEEIYEAQEDLAHR